jgi:prevent-host-death family protein
MSTVSISDASRELSRLVNRAAFGNEIVILSSRGRAKAVLLGLETFQELIGMREHAKRQLVPLDTFQQQFQQALADAGYETTEKIVAMVREVKNELVAERDSEENP